MKICIDATVNDERGIHARPAALIVKACRDYPGDVTVLRTDEPDSQPCDCKDMMSLIEMEAACGTKVRFCVETPAGISMSDLDEEEKRAHVLCRRLREIVAMTLEEIEHIQA